MKLFKSKKAVAIGVTAGLVLGIAGGAFAYFTASNGSDSGSATVGTSTAWNVVNDGTSGGPLYPGAGSEVVSYTVTNPSTGHQYLKSVKVTVDADGSGDVLSTASGNPAITGCKAAWFNVVDDNTGLPADITGGGTYSKSSTITLPNITTTNQDPCQGASFTVTITASSV